MSTVVQKRIGQEWCEPIGYSESDRMPYPSFIAVKSNRGYLILCNVFQDMNTGEISRVPVKSYEIAKL